MRSWGLLAPKPLGRGMIPLHPHFAGRRKAPAGKMGGLNNPGGHHAPGGVWGGAPHLLEHFNRELL